MRTGPLHDSVWRNPYLYLSYSVAPLRDSTTIAVKTAAALTGDVYDRLKSIALQAGPGDRIEVTKFVPGNITATVITEHAAILVLQQTSYPGWKVFADGRPMDYFTSAYSNISILLPAGVHHMVYAFDPGYLYPLIGVSMVTLLAIIAGLIIYRKRLL